MSKKDEALKLARHVMHNQGDIGVDEWIATEKAIDEALAEPVQQEPVAWGIVASNTGRICQVELDADEVEGHNPKHIVPLYTSPPAQRKPLTDDEYEALVEDLEYWSRYVEVDTAHQSLEAHVRKVLAAHGIKENT